MQNLSVILLKPGKDAAVRRFHPWIFSGAISRADGNPEPGDMVRIVDSNRNFLALGHYLKGDIAVKIFSFEEVDISRDYWHQRLLQCFLKRRSMGIATGEPGQAYRLVYSEGDGLPGLIIDYYDGVAVIQASSKGMRRLLPVFTEALTDIYSENLKTVYDKSDDKEAEFTSGSRFLYGSSDRARILENGNHFLVDFVNGQKTGFFLDQRLNRLFAHFYAKDRVVLNAFCYSGAFTVYALRGGAKKVRSVDISRKAIDWTIEHVALNGMDPSLHEPVVADVKDFLVTTKDAYDMIILDPPAFAKSHRVSNNALHAYIHINAAAMNRLDRGGLLMTFSCSQAVSREMFRAAIQSAAIETGRRVSVLHQLSQGPDHPVNACHPEGDYLKGLILMVE